MRRTFACALAALTGCFGAILPASAALGSAPATGPSMATTVAAGFSWSALASSPLGSRSGALVVWAGGQLLEIGGLVGKAQRPTSAAAAFTPRTGRWRRIASVPGAAGASYSAPSGLSLYPASVWTGRYLAVANGPAKSCAAKNSGCWTGVGLYDPAANRWTRLTLPKQLAGLDVTAVTWTGRDIAVAAVDGADFGTSKGRLGLAEYAPATRRWTVLTPPVPRAHPSRYPVLSNAGGRLLLWSMWDRVNKTKDGFSDYAGVDVLAMNARGAWRNVTGSWPQEQTVGTPSSTPDGLLFPSGEVWCGVACIPPYFAYPGFFANTATLARKAIPAGPLGKSATYVWAGDAIMGIDLGYSSSGPGINVVPGDMALFKPTTGRWTGLPAVPGQPSLSTTPVWTGTELLVLTDAGSLYALHS
jgi:hypothetical protein